MKIDSGFGFFEDFSNVHGLKDRISEYEDIGFDGVLTTEIAHDPFLLLMLGATETTHIELRTSIAVAFARSPMTLAYTAHDINSFSKGRFTLGLGSQIKPHITKRFGMPWNGPAKQMKEYLQALKAIWACWYQKEPLRFEGETYKHTLMTPDFTPDNTEAGPPRLVLAAVGPRMMQVAAEETDGIIMHSFNTEKYLDEQVLPKIAATLAERNKTLEDFEICFPTFVVTGDNEEAFEKSKAATKYRIGFYGSTPAYRSVLECHGWGDLQPRLTAMTKEGKWDQLGSMIDDEMLSTFACVGEPLQVAEILRERYKGKVDRIALENSLPRDIVRKQFEIIRKA